MVFELTDTLIDEAASQTADYQTSFHNLFLGYEEGNLLLSVSPDLLDFLSDRLNDTLSLRVINHLQNTPLVHYNVLWQVKVVLNNPDISNREIAIDFFKATSAVQPPTFLCENLDDTKFYIALCEEYFGDLFLNTKNSQGGGGSSIADNLEQIVNNHDRFCLCVVDSDIKYPGCGDGGTYAAIINKGLAQDTSFDVYKLNVHEIENLIPFTITIKYIKDKHVRKFAQRLLAVDLNGDILKYYDIKEGIKKGLVEKEQGCMNFAANIYNRFKKASDITPFETYLQSIKDEHIFSPICPGILVSFLKISPRQLPRFIYCDYLREEWQHLREIIVTYLCARQAVPLN